MERNSRKIENIRNIRNTGLMVLGAVALAVGIKQCASPIPESAGSTSTAVYEDGRIDTGTNLRTSPERTESQSDTTSNACAQANETIHFSANVTVEDRPRSANGAWVGIPTESLPQDIQEQCSDTQDDKIWVAQEYVNEG